MTGRRRRLWAVALLAIVLPGAVLIGRRAGTALVVSMPVDDPEAIMVLASHEWERLPAAAALAKAHPAALVFLSAPRTPTIHNCHDCAGRVQRLINAGVAVERIVTLPRLVSNTRDEAAAARDECARRHLRRLLVTTSPYHTRRAWTTFQEVFTNSGVTLGITPATPSAAKPEGWWRDPYDRSYVRYEWAAILYHGARP